MQRPDMSSPRPSADGTVQRWTARLRQLVELETPSCDAERLRRAYEVLLVWGHDAMGRPGEVVIVEGTPHLQWVAGPGPSVLVLCHVDTVWPAGTIDDWPFTVENGRASGPGVFDMKAGVIVALEAISRLEDTSGIALLLTGDEEVGSPTSRRLIEQAAASAAAVLVLEPGLDGALKTERKGCSIYEIDFAGLSAHAGLEPEKGHNALLELCSLALECVSWADPSRGTTVTPTTARAGTTHNTVPSSARLMIDVRSHTAAELRRVDDLVTSWSGADTDVRPTVRGGINRPPLESSASHGLFDLACQVSAEAGLGVPSRASVGGASDGNFTAALGVPTLDGLGAAGGGAHAAHEWIDLSSMESCVELLAGLITQITQDTATTTVEEIP